MADGRHVLLDEHESASKVVSFMCYCRSAVSQLAQWGLVYWVGSVVFRKGRLVVFWAWRVH